MKSAKYFFPLFAFLIAVSLVSCMTVDFRYPETHYFKVSKSTPKKELSVIYIMAPLYISSIGIDDVASPFRNFPFVSGVIYVAPGEHYLKIEYYEQKDSPYFHDEKIILHSSRSYNHKFEPGKVYDISFLWEEGPDSFSFSIMESKEYTSETIEMRLSAAQKKAKAEREQP